MLKERIYVTNKEKLKGIVSTNIQGTSNSYWPHVIL